MKTQNVSLSQPAPETFSGEWRTQEAKDIFDLLRNEYANSKSLNVVKRYKELERIINMFTSEPVLMKLLWLSTKDSDSTSTNAQTPSELGRLKSDAQSSVDGCVWSQSSSNSQERVLDGLKTITTRLRSMAPLVSALSFIKSSASNDSGLSSESDDTSRLCSCQDPNCSGVGYSSSDSNVSTPDKPLVSPSSISTSSCFVFNKGCLTSDPDVFSPCRFSHVSGNGLSNQADGIFFSCRSTAPTAQGNMFETSSSSSSSTGHTHSSTTTTTTATKESAVRRHGIETCVIKRDDIPSFTIPPQRTLVPQQADINPLFYLHHNSTAKNSPAMSRCSRMATSPFLTASVSTPNMTDRGSSCAGSKSKSSLTLGNTHKKRCCSDNLLDRSCYSENGKEISDCEDIIGFHPHSSKCVNGLCCGSPECITITHLLKAHETLNQMKSDFKVLNGKNLLTKYKKMKTIIKSCMDLEI